MDATPPRLLAQLIEGLSDRLLTGDASRAALAAMAGATVACHLPGWGRLTLLIERDGLTLIDAESGDLEVEAELPVLLMAMGGRLAERLAPGGTQSPTAPGQGMTLRGDAALAANFQRLLETIDVDPEGLLAPLIGDLPAHRLTALGRQAARNGYDALARLLRTTVDYWQYEQRALVPRVEVEALAEEASALGERVTRLAERMERLQRAQGKRP